MLTTSPAKIFILSIISTTLFASEKNTSTIKRVESELNKIKRSLAAHSNAETKIHDELSDDEAVYDRASIQIGFSPKEEKYKEFVEKSLYTLKQGFHNENKIQLSAKAMADWIITLIGNEKVFSCTKKPYDHHYVLSISVSREEDRKTEKWADAQWHILFDNIKDFGRVINGMKEEKKQPCICREAASDTLESIIKKAHNNEITAHLSVFESQPKKQSKSTPVTIKNAFKRIRAQAAAPSKYVKMNQSSVTDK